MTDTLPETREYLGALLARGIEIDAADATPRYIRLANALRLLIETDALGTGAALPSERLLAEITGLSRVTVRRGIELLVREGVLEQRRGSGTYVLAPVERFEQPLAAITSFTEDMLSYGRKPETRWLAREYASPSAQEAMTLGLSPGDRVLRLHRLRLADALPLAVELAIVPADLLPDLSALGTSLYESMASAGARPHKALQRMHACALPEFEARLLEAEAGEPALFLERISRTVEGRVVEFTRSHFKGDRFDFVAELNLHRET
ncbi:GntR family transcriptional regulator [Nitratireductor rhodophyticola]|uniref:GntR family transcriptional regulator n=1 Tax=Nitratireductor rhodophyticola TaxID=2854036 RepID=UPI000814112D|nr:GntR family transcriptional regulator [Nitratireductor rhodophyticola]MEC9244733.1 GntR family transcriptional regulator [Pseudomonadota bacterium]WPZ15449.1 GntR family transcriptional regulator [Nitratireductor rhodophyticola]